MRRLVSAAEALRLDRETLLAWGLAPDTLMEAAASRLASTLEGLLAEERFRGASLVALAGAGNNGGDALALLRHLSFAGWKDSSAVVLPAAVDSLAALQAGRLRSGGIPVHEWPSPGASAALARAGLLIDGIAGTGLKGPLHGAPLDLLRAASACSAPIASIDLPSGLRDGAGPGEETMPATWTLSIEPRKLCLLAPAYRPRAGVILAVEGVFPLGAGRSGAFLADSGDLDPPSLASFLHKGQRGRLALLAGSPGMFGAASLALEAAAAGGAGLLTHYVEDSIFPSLAGRVAEAPGGAILRPESALIDELGRHDAVLVGPGWALSEEHARLLGLLLESEVALIIDASALRLLPQSGPGGREGPGNRPLALTPHPGELSALSGLPVDAILASPGGVLAELSEVWKAAIILKAGTSWIAAPGGELCVVDGQEPGLAVAGSGDVLAGLAAALLAGFEARDEGGRGGRAARALRLAALVHLDAGRSARAEKGWYRAGDLLTFIARSLGQP